MACPRTLNTFSRGRRTAIVAILGGLWAIGPLSIDLCLLALPGTCADMTVC